MHQHTPEAVVGSDIDLPNMDKIRNIIFSGDTGDTGDVGVNDVGAEGFDEGDVEEIPRNGPDAHPDPCTDATYTSRPKTPIPSQEVLLNDKWSDTKMWAQRAIAHTKCDKTLEAERLYCRQATLSHEDPNHHLLRSCRHYNKQIPRDRDHKTIPKTPRYYPSQLENTEHTNQLENRANIHERQWDTKSARNHGASVTMSTEDSGTIRQIEHLTGENFGS